MSPSAKSLGIDRLSLAERILLVEEIGDGIVAEGEALKSHNAIRMNSTEESRTVPQISTPALSGRD